MDRGGLPLDVGFLGFNQDGSCLAVAGLNGFAVLDAESGRVLYRETACGHVRLVEMLFRTSLLALVGGGQLPSSSCQLTMWNAKGRCSICTLRFAAEICAVRLNHRRAVVLLRHKIHIFDLKTMKALLVIDRDPVSCPNLAALGADAERGFLATPLAPPRRQDVPFAHGVEGAGYVAVVDAHTLRAVGTLLAHRTPVRALCLNAEGRLLATASDKGTVVRVFGVPSLSLLWTFRRGVSPCRIYSLSFAAGSPHLSAAAASGTVHVFRLPGAANQHPAPNAAPPRRQPVRLGPQPNAEEAAQKEGLEVASLDEWNVVAPDEGGLLLSEGAMCGRHDGSVDTPAKLARSLLWELLQPWQELADAPYAFSWLRLHPGSVDAAGMVPRVEHPGYVACVLPKPPQGPEGSCKLAVATEDGAFRIYTWSALAGGEGQLLFRDSLQRALRVAPLPQPEGKPPLAGAPAAAVALAASAEPPAPREDAAAAPPPPPPGPPMAPPPAARPVVSADEEDSPPESTGPSLEEQEEEEDGEEMDKKGQKGPIASTGEVKPLPGRGKRSRPAAQGRRRAR